MKEELRSKLKSVRRNLSVEQIIQASKKINEQLQLFLADKKCVMVYLSSFKEVCVDDTIQALLEQGKIVAAPITDEENISITPFELKDLKAVAHGAYGIREPLREHIISKDSIDAIIIPGIGFDSNGGRLGFGKGYYDKFLSDFKGLKIGVCYDFQLVDKIETEEQDIPMDIIITEEDYYVI